jgi:dGTP triphosphohydrolase
MNLGLFKWRGQAAAKSKEAREVKVQANSVCVSKYFRDRDRTIFCSGLRNCTKHISSECTG